MPSQLGIYNDALRLSSERRLVTLADNTEGRRLLDDAWVDAPQYCLEQGEWNFAMRTARVSYSPSVEPPFGYRRAFSKDDDWVRTSAVSSDEYFNNPLTAYADEQGYWFADPDEIFVRFISNRSDYGGVGNMGAWPVTFAKFMSAYLAREISGKLSSGDVILKRAEAAMDKFKKQAQANNAMNTPTTFMPQGGWNRSRLGRYGSGRYDRGNPHSLYG